jgi:hypothetical protein
MDAIVAVLVDDNCARVNALLKLDAGLTTRLISEARLYESEIFYWIYVGDTALHFGGRRLGERYAG